MWIIPKNLHTLASVQDTEALISDSQELSDLYEQSLLWRSKPSPSRTWLKRLKQGGWIEHLSTATLKPSHTHLFEGEWTSSQEASLVSHLAPQEDEQETTTQDTCGPISPKESENWDSLPLFSSRMLRGSSAPNSKETDGPTQRAHLFCSMSSENWKDWVMKQRREYSARVKSVRPISANECSSWVVAPISARQGEGSLIGCSATQSEGNLWATIRVGASKAPAGGGDPSKEDHPYRIENQVQETYGPPQEEQSNILGSPQGSLWTTPIARDCFEIVMNQGLDIRTDGKTRMDTMPRQVHHQEGYKGKLNPRWVETLMGVPVGWVMPSCANPWIIERMNCVYSEMESCPPQQGKPLESSGQALEEVLNNRDAYPWVDDD